MATRWLFNTAKAEPGVCLFDNGSPFLCASVLCIKDAEHEKVHFPKRTEKVSLYWRIRSPGSIIHLPCPSFLKIVILASGENDGLDDDDFGVRLHCDSGFLQELNDPLVWPAMNDVAHHIDIGFDGLWGEEVVNLIRYPVLEFGREVLPILFDSLDYCAR